MHGLGRTAAIRFPDFRPVQAEDADLDADADVGTTKDVLDDLFKHQLLLDVSGHIRWVLGAV
jgi:hypothetical protein